MRWIIITDIFWGDYSESNSRGEIRHHLGNTGGRQEGLMVTPERFPLPVRLWLIRAEMPSGSDVATPYRPD